MRCLYVRCEHVVSQKAHIQDSLCPSVDFYAQLKQEELLQSLFSSRQIGSVDGVHLPPILY